jgi:hypothetical protein
MQIRHNFKDISRTDY